MNAIKQLAGQTAIYGLSSIVPRLLNYLLVPFYTRIFLPEVYGIVTEMYAYVAFLIIILTYGMETGFFRFAAGEKDLNKVYSTCLVSLFITSFTFVVIVIINAQTIANILQYHEHREYIVWFGIILGIDAFMTIPFAWLRQNNKPIQFSIIKIINVCINIGLNLFFLVLCPKIISTNPQSFLSILSVERIGVGYVFISNLIASLITLVLVLPIIIKVKLKIDLKLLKRILMYSTPLLVAGFAGTINEMLDRVLLKHLLPDYVNPMEQLGLYGANIKIAVLMILFIQMFRYAAEPFFFKHAKEKDSKVLFAEVTKYFIIFGLIIFLGIMMYIDIVKFFIGEKYRSGLNIVPILLMANLFLGIFYNLSIWYKINNITKYGAYLALFGAGITITLNILFIPKIGYIASAWAHLICYIFMVVLSYLWGRKIYRIPYKIGRFFIYIGCALILYYLSLLNKNNMLCVKLIINSVLFISFIVIVLIKEKGLLNIIRNKRKAEKV